MQTGVEEAGVADAETAQWLDAVPEPMLVWDAQGRLLHANAAARAWLGDPIPEPLARQVARTVGPPADADGPEPPRRLRFRQADGTELSLDCTVHRVGASQVVGTLRPLVPEATAHGLPATPERGHDLPRYVEALARASRHLCGGLDLPEVLQVVVRTLVYDFDASLARVWLLDPADGWLQLHASAGLTEQVAGDPLARVDPGTDRTELGQVARSRLPVVRVLSGGEGGERTEGGSSATAMAGLAVLPLLAGGELRGLLLHAARRPLDAAVVDCLTGFAAVVAAAVNDVLILRREQAARIEAHDHRAKLQTILDSVSVGVLLAEGPEGRLTVTNPAARALLGHEVNGQTLDWFLSQHPARRLDGGPIAPEDRPFWRALHAGERQCQTLRLGRADGSELVVDLMATPFPGPHGGAVSAFADVTARLRLEAELGERAAQLKALLDHLPVGVAYFDAQGVCRACNGPARRILGPDRREIQGVAAAELFAHRPALRDGLERCIATDTPHADDGVPWELEPNQTRYLDWRFQPLPRPSARGNRGALALVLDVTERALAEFALQRAAEAAESASRRKTQFLSAVSHDLRTPVNALSLQAELLAQLIEVRGGNDTDLIQLTADIRKVAANLIDLINDLLDLTRFDSGVIDYQPTVFELDEFLTQTLTPLATTAGARGLDFRWQVDRAGRLVRGDRVKLARVLTNLAGNAVKFTDQGRVEVVAEAGPDGGLWLAVHDTGPGIPESQLERIFDEFAQLRNPERDRTKGTGLGLAICRRLVEGLGGRLTVESQTGQGSSFRAQYPGLTMSADLPARPVIPTAPPPPPPTPAPLEQPILLVEDDTNSRQTLARLLGHAGYEVVTAESGQAALDVLERLRPGLVLLDLMMPGIDGTEVLRRIRADRRWADLKVVLLTGDLLGNRSSGEMAALNVDGFLAKPVDFNRLLETVARFATHRTVLRHPDGEDDD